MNAGRQYSALALSPIRRLRSSSRWCDYRRLTYASSWEAATPISRLNRFDRVHLGASGWVPDSPTPLQTTKEFISLPAIGWRMVGAWLPILRKKFGVYKRGYLRHPVTLYSDLNLPIRAGLRAKDVKEPRIEVSYSWLISVHDYGPVGRPRTSSNR